MFRVLKPRYERTGEVLQTLDGPMHWNRVIWVDVGQARDMADAKKKYGGYPVLAPMTTLH